MGMYSSFDWEEVEVIDKEGLKMFLKAWKEFFKGNENMLPYVTEMTNYDEEKNQISFERWDNTKLISYWYDETCLFLKLIAKYIEGEVHWIFETPDEGGYVEFRDGKCIINYGNMQWDNKDADKMIGKHVIEKPNMKKFIKALETDDKNYLSALVL